MGSTRLPGKVLLKVGEYTMLEYLLRRISFAEKINEIIIATGDEPSNKEIEKICKKMRMRCFVGSENDVLGRYYTCYLKNLEYDYIIRLTADNPLVDPVVIDEMIQFVEDNPQYDYVSNNIIRSFPYGLDVEIFKKEVLVDAACNAQLLSEREHVTLYIKKNNKFKKANFLAKFDFSHFRLTVDYENDFKIVKFLIKNSQISDGYLKYVSLLTKNFDLMSLNMHVVKDEGLLKSLRNDSIVDKSFLS